MVFLHRRAWYRINAGWRGQPLQIRHDRGLGVLGDHVTGVHTWIVGEKRRQPLVARDIQVTIRAALRHACDVGHGNSEEVEDIADWRTVEVAVGLHPPVKGDHWVIDRRRELSRRDERGMIDSVPGGTGYLWRATQRVRVLNARAFWPSMTSH